MSPERPCSRPLILASTSRYRAALLERFGLPFNAAQSGGRRGRIAGRIAAGAGLRGWPRPRPRRVAAHFPDAMVIGGDQVRGQHGTILNKPGNAANCREQLKLLSGSTAEFYTACTVRCIATGLKLSHVDTTTVKLRPLSRRGDRPLHRARETLRLRRRIQGRSARHHAVRTHGLRGPHRHRRTAADLAGRRACAPRATASPN